MPECCPWCNGECDSQATTCPHCGRLVREEWLRQDIKKLTIAIDGWRRHTDRLQAELAEAKAALDKSDAEAFVQAAKDNVEVGNLVPSFMVGELVAQARREALEVAARVAFEETQGMMAEGVWLSLFVSRLAQQEPDHD